MAKKKISGQAEAVAQEEAAEAASEDEQPGDEVVEGAPPEAEAGAENEDEAAQEDPEEEDADQDPVDPASEDAEETASPVSAPAAADETAGLRAELLEARSQLAAYAAGVAPDMIADAVTLATAEAQRAGEVTEAAITQAMANVLKRHPEWKADATKPGVKKTGGFKLGADRDNAGNPTKPAGNNQAVKRWNRFK